VGGAGTNLYNSSSQVAIVRQGTKTTLTMANNVYGSGLTDFAIVVPVPQVLGPDDVKTVEPSIFDVLDQYSAPRLVTYECEDFYWEDDMAEADGSGGGSPPSDLDGVTVESLFVVGSYEIAVLSAEDSSSLLVWLEANGYNGLDESAAALLNGYIEAGQYFFAAKVFLGALPEDAAYLEPIQVSYTADAFTLPIRLGTLNAPEDGAQDLFIYTLTDTAAGAVGISNYPEITVEDECMWRADEWPNFGAFWADTINSGRLAAGGAAWIQEYSWSTGWCDPCSGDPPNDTQVALLGYDGPAHETHFSRLHMQYTPDAVTQELMLYASGIADMEQIRYIVYEEELEERFPICFEETPEEPGSCDDGSGVEDDVDVDTDTPEDTGTDGDLDDGTGASATEIAGLSAYEPDEEKTRKGGCSVSGRSSQLGFLGWLSLGLVFVRRRR
jgi:MYXO-CTERM domain-containing protein